MHVKSGPSDFFGSIKALWEKHSSDLAFPAGLSIGTQIATGSARPIVSISEACAIAGIGRTSLYKAIRAGALRAIKIGRRTLLLQDDIRQWLEGMPAVAARRPTSDTPSGPSVIVHDGSGALPPSDG